MLILIGRGLDLKRGEKAKERRASVGGIPQANIRERVNSRSAFPVWFSGRSPEQTNELNTISGDNGKRDPPVPIPNTEVKPLRADGTWLATARESRSSPDSKEPVM